MEIQEKLDQPTLEKATQNRHLIIHLEDSLQHVI